MEEIIRWPRHLYGESLEDSRIASDEADAQRLYALGYMEAEEFDAARKTAAEGEGEVAPAKPKRAKA